MCIVSLVLVAITGKVTIIMQAAHMARAKQGANLVAVIFLLLSTATAKSTCRVSPSAQHGNCGMPDELSNFQVRSLFNGMDSVTAAWQRQHCTFGTGKNNLIIQYISNPIAS